jgi:hypothetical protein
MQSSSLANMHRMHLLLKRGRFRCRVAGHAARPRRSRQRTKGYAYRRERPQRSERWRAGTYVRSAITSSACRSVCAQRQDQGRAHHMGTLSSMRLRRWRCSDPFPGAGSDDQIRRGARARERTDVNVGLEA